MHVGVEEERVVGIDWSVVISGLVDKGEDGLHLPLISSYML